MSEHIRILVIDDHPLLREGVCYTLDAEDDFEVVGQGESYDHAMSMAQELLPDMILLDVSMPGGGVNAARDIHIALPKIKLIILTVSEDEKDVTSALKAGASAYILKGIGGKDLVKIVHRIAEGETFITASLASSILLSSNAPETNNDKVLLKSLSERETIILKALERGLTNRQIADELFLSEKTIKHYMTSIMQKLQVRNRLEAALLAQKMEMTD